jgi:hypothetical protein
MGWLGLRVEPGEVGSAAYDRQVYTVQQEEKTKSRGKDGKMFDEPSHLLAVLVKYLHLLLFGYT